MQDKRAERLAALALLLVTIIWGSGFIGVELALDVGLSVSFILMGRMLLGAALLGVLFFRRIYAAGRPSFRHGVVAGVLLFLASYTQTAGQQSTTVSKSAFLTATYVIMIPFLVWAVAKKRPPAKVFALAGLTLVGVAILTLSGQAEEGFSFVTGDLLVLCSALLFAAHIVYLGFVCRTDDPIALTSWQLLMAGIIATFAFLLSGSSPTPEQLRSGLWLVVYLGAFSTCLCFFLQTHAQRHISPAKAGILLSMEGFFGSLFSVLLGLEPLRFSLVLGGLLITASVILVEVDLPLRRKKDASVKRAKTPENA